MGTVVLESRPSGSATWTTVATLPVGTYGIASRTVRPLERTYYRGRRVADVDHLEGVSPEVLVKGVKLSSTGAFSVRWRERRRGTRKFRLMMRTRTYLQGYSRTKAVRWG